jgi:hypothetical protein
MEAMALDLHSREDGSMLWQDWMARRLGAPQETQGSERRQERPAEAAKDDRAEVQDPRPETGGGTDKPI